MGLAWAASSSLSSPFSRTAPRSTVERPATTAPAPSAAPTPPAAYRLSPAQRARAIVYSRLRYQLYFLGVALSILIYTFLWLGRFGVNLRGRARRISAGHFRQCLLFAPAFFIAAGLLELPFDFVSGFSLGRRFGLSTETPLGWLADWGKTLGVSIAAGVFLVWIFYLIVRRSPRRWWLYFWMVTIPVTLLVIFVEPYVIEPLYFKFTPLDRTHPELVEKIEDMLHHGGIVIPPARIFEMNASSKTRTLNAYVSGFGASKRVVVWDTTLDKMTPDEILLVLGHETGHYALHHIPREFVWIQFITLGFLALGFGLVRVLVQRFGPSSGLEGEGDLASLPLMLLVLTILSFLSSPPINAVSRHYEHQADQFALEVTHGVVPNPNAAQVMAFQVLGAEDLSDPDPGAFIKFWLYSHPPLAERIRFASSYKPWAEGKPMELLPHDEPAPGAQTGSPHALPK